MNASQRRKAYRTIKALAGTSVEVTLKSGETRKGVVVGLVKVLCDERPVLNRCRVRLESKATMSPLLSALKFI